MAFSGFTKEDFDVFLIEGLEARMEALKERIRPKLEILGQHFAPILTSLTDDEMFVHVAKHARRTINPPKDTWVAFANNPRGYKMLPHFQIGLWNSHLFVWFAVIYEAPHKEEIAKKFANKAAKIYKEIPKDYFWSQDHMKPDAIQHGKLSKPELLNYFGRLQTVKKAEILCGTIFEQNTAIELGADQLLVEIEKVFTHVAPLYKIALNIK